MKNKRIEHMSKMSKRHGIFTENFFQMQEKLNTCRNLNLINPRTPYEQNYVKTSRYFYRKLNIFFSNVGKTEKVPEFELDKL